MRKGICYIWFIRDSGEIAIHLECLGSPVMPMRFHCVLQCTFHLGRGNKIYFILLVL